MNHFDEFKPDTVEEQITQMAQAEAEGSTGSEVVQALQAFYARDASMIDRVWRRLESAQQESAVQEPSSQEEMRYERISSMQMPMSVAEQKAVYIPLTNPLRGKKRSFSRSFALLASAIVSVIVISSVIFALNSIRQSAVQPGGTVSPVIHHTSPTPAITPTDSMKPNPSGIYLVNALGVYRLDRVSGKQRWFYDIKADPNTKPGATHRVSTQVLLSNGVAYFGGNDFQSDNYNFFYLYALNATTGKLLWRQPVEAELNNLVKGEDGVIYASAVNDSGYAFNSDGSLHWSRSFSSGALSPRSFVQLEQGVLYATNGETISAFRAENGQQIWAESSAAGGFIGGIKVVNGVLYATNYIPSTDSSGAGSSYVQAYRASSGDLLWQSQSIEQSLFAAPGAANGFVYAGSASGQVYALDVRNGQIKWQKNAGHSIYAPVYPSGNTLIAATAGAGDAHIIAYNATTGNQKWSQLSASFESPSDRYMVVTASKVYYSSLGSVHVMSLAGGQQIAEFPVSEGQHSTLTVVE